MRSRRGSAHRRRGRPGGVQGPAGPDRLVDRVVPGTLRPPRRRTQARGRAPGIKGVTEETTTGVNRVDRLAEQGGLPFPAINVNDSVTKSKFDNRYGIRHSLPDGLNRATDVLIGGKIAVVVGYGDVGKGAAEALRGQGARVIVTEIDPICALQATMDGYQVDHLAEVAPQADIVITTTGNTRVVGVEVLQTLKPGAIIGNVG